MPAAVRFEQLLQQLRSRGGTSSSRPVGPPRPPSQLRQPTFQPRLGKIHAFPAARGTVAGAGATRGAARRSSAAAQAKHALAASIRHAAAGAGVEPALSVAVARAESSLNPGARSPDGRSVGTFQMLPSTAAEMRRKIAAGVVERPPGTDDVALGVGYLGYLHDLFGRNARLGHGLATVAVPNAGERRLFAVAAYNAGEGRVARAQARAADAGGDPTSFADVRRFLPKLTQGYVERVTAYAREELPTSTAV